jgi:uncharacterized cupin superfamily protein
LEHPAVPSRQPGEAAPLGAHARAVHLESWAQLDEVKTFIPAMQRSVRGKLFLLPALGLTGMEASITKLPPGYSVPFFHKHRENEELYVILSGTGEFQVDGDVVAIGPGSAVGVKPDGERTLRNTGAEDLVYLCVQAREGSLGGDGGVSDGIPLSDPVRW